MLSSGSHWLLVRGSGSADVTVLDRKHFLPDGREAQGAATLRVGTVYAPFAEEPLRVGDWLVLLDPHDRVWRLEPQQIEQLTLLEVAAGRLPD